MPISADFTIDYVNKRVTHTSGATVYTVNQLYSYLQDTFDELDQMDDTIPMTAQTPTDYTLVNSWYMDETSFQFLKTGAIKTIGWDASSFNDGVRILTFASGGYVNAIAGDIGKVVTYTGGVPANTGTLLAYNNTLRKWWVRVDDTGDTYANTATAIVITTGTGTGTLSAASVTGENLYSNIYTLGSIQEDESQQIYIIQNGAKLTSWWPESGSGTQQIDVLIKVKEAGTLISSGILTVFLRHYPAALEGDLYDHFIIDVSPGGRNAVPLSTANDLNNTTSATSIGGTVTDVTIAFVNKTIAHGAITNGPYEDFETITGGTSSATGIFLKTSSGTMTLGNVVGTFANGEVLTGGTSAATSTSSGAPVSAYTVTKAFEQQSAFPYSVIIDCATRNLSQVYQYLKYVTRESSSYVTYPTTTVNGPTTSHSTLAGEQYIIAHIDSQGTPTNTFTPVKAAPFGTFAGGKLFGAQGVWVENMATADIQAFQLIDSNGVTRTPPNKQAIAVTNLLQLDRVTVFRTVSTTDFSINKTLYTSHNTNNTTGAGTFEVTTSIDTDTPTTGTLRVVDTQTGNETRYAYTAFSGAIFTLSGTLSSTYTNVDTAYVPFIDKEVGAAETSASVTVIYPGSDRGLLIRVRRKATTAILPFEATGVFGSTGYSISTIRTTDTIVT